MTIKETYDKVMASDELKASFTEAAKSKETLEKWLKDQGSDASVEEVTKFLQSKAEGSGELSDDELENVAGGGKFVNGIKSAGLSIVTLTAYCITEAVWSNNDKKEGKAETNTNGEICTTGF